jgi:hypothetical protein
MVLTSTAAMVGPMTRQNEDLPKPDLPGQHDHAEHR